MQRRPGGQPLIKGYTQVGRSPRGTNTGAERDLKELVAQNKTSVESEADKSITKATEEDTIFPGLLNWNL